MYDEFVYTWPTKRNIEIPACGKYWNNHTIQFEPLTLGFLLEYFETNGNFRKFSLILFHLSEWREFRQAELVSTSTCTKWAIRAEKSSLFHFGKVEMLVEYLGYSFLWLKPCGHPNASVDQWIESVEITEAEHCKCKQKCCWLIGSDFITKSKMYIPSNIKNSNELKMGSDIVWDRNSVSVSGSKTKVQFRYRYLSRNFFFLKPKLQNFSIFSNFLIFFCLGDKCF